MLGLILGVLTILLGTKAFTQNGIPLTKRKYLKGTTAKVIGVACILFGLACIADGVMGTFGIFRMFGS